MNYIIVTLINFILIYICCHCFQWNKNSCSYRKEKKYERISFPVWAWILICIAGLLSYFGLIFFLTVLIFLLTGLIIDDDLIFDPKLKNIFTNSFIGKFFSKISNLLIKNISI